MANLECRQPLLWGPALHPDTLGLHLQCGFISLMSALAPLTADLQGGDAVLQVAQQLQAAQARLALLAHA